MTAREVLINLSLYKNGDWGDIYHMILKREKAMKIKGLRHILRIILISKTHKNCSFYEYTGGG